MELMPDPLDLRHLGRERVIGSYLLETDDGPALQDCGPTTCVPELKARLADHGLELTDVRHLLLSHIHLDHAGAAGVLVREHPRLQGHVSEGGSPHLVDPSRPERSARGVSRDRLHPPRGRPAPPPGAGGGAARGGSRAPLPPASGASSHPCRRRTSMSSATRRSVSRPSRARATRPTTSATSTARARSSPGTQRACASSRASSCCRR